MMRIDPNTPVVLQAVNMACGLMAGDPATFKAGYSQDSAYLSVVEYFSLDEQDAASVKRILEKRKAMGG